MNKNIAIVLVAALVVIGAIVVFVGGDEDDLDNGDTQDISIDLDSTEPDGSAPTDDDTDVTPENPDPDTNGDGTVDDNDVSVGYVMYTSEDLDFRMLQPDDASVNRETDTRVKFTFLGPQNATGEITDGFTVTVHRDLETDATTVRSYAEEVRAEESNVLTGLEERTVNGMTAYRYSFETELGPRATTYVFLPEDGRGYTATYSVSDPNDRGYQTVVFNMLESIEFLGPDGVPTFSEVSIALLDIEQESSGVERGCDRVVMVDRNVDPTRAPLTAALNELFSLEDTTVDEWYNFMARTNDTLSFDRARVENGVAHIYLEGELSGLQGVCDNPRARIQIEETALEFSTVESVQLYLNEEATDLQPDESGQ